MPPATTVTNLPFHKRLRHLIRRTTKQPHHQQAQQQTYPPLPYHHLFRYASFRDRLTVTLALFAAIAHGATMPMLIIVFGRITDQFGRMFLPPTHPEFIPQSDINSIIVDTTNWALILGAIVAVLAFTQVILALHAANSIGNNLRHRFFNSLLSQDADFYDDTQVGALTHLVISDINLIQGGIGDKLATAVQYLTNFIVGLIVGFIYGWKLTLLIVACAPILLLAGIAFGNASAQASSGGLGAYAESSGIASEVLNLIRTVTAYGRQKEELARYETTLDKAYRSACKAALNSALGLGLAMASIFCIYGLAFWVGSILVRNNSMSTGDVLLTFLAVTLGASNLGAAGPTFKSFGLARAAAPRVFEIIDRHSPINPLDDHHGFIPTQPTSGHIQFENVDFNYRKRITEEGDSNLVLNHFNLDISVGTSEAFVGKSGCGKSTVARLIQRVYDPISGVVRLDGTDIRQLNVRWLRSQIGVVSQTPSLFMLSIKDNIALGAGLEFDHDPKTGNVQVHRKQVSDDDIIYAAKMANAHGFISKLPEGYDTMLGERGAMLSGGQKQRVCIARALVRNPKILVLDESTSSLDTASERLVQDALEKASAGRTTVTIAHRLSTVRNSDNISFIQSGHVLERGKHSELIRREDGFYRNLFELQNIERAKFEEEKVQQAAEGGFDQAPQLTVSVSKTGPDSSTVHVGDAVEEETKPAIDKGLFWRTLKLNYKEWPLLLFGFSGAALVGIVWPLSAISLTELIEDMLAENDPSDIRFWAISYVVIGGMALLGNILQHGLMGIAGEKVTRKLRGQAFQSLLRQEMGYFDMEDNSVGALTGRLAADAGAVKGLTGDLLGVGINVVASLICGLSIAFARCWRVTLVVLTIIPGVALAGYFEMQSTAGIDSGARKGFASANRVAAEAVDNITTVRSISAEDYFRDRYHEMTAATRKSLVRKMLLTACGFAFSEFCFYLLWYAAYKSGGDFVEKFFCDFKQLLQATLAIMFSAITLGNVAVWAPDVGASQLGATHIYRLLDRKSQIDPEANTGEDLDHVHGDVEAKNVRFEYPRRPDVPVLRGLNMTIERCKTLAIVGKSGHGKSTIICLLEKFYDVRTGKLSIDEHDVSTVKVQDLRSQMSIVSQEPELFNRSVFDNIVYGAVPDEDAPISMSDVEDAARLASAHEFIKALPEGYDTKVGPRGESLSGGQRQRVAIARGLMRKPPILLLDEATSSLDSSSERLVQKALEDASGGRTTIVVAHRLSTVKNADTIAVVRKGRVVESGSHNALLHLNGYYAELIEHQLTDV